MYTFDKKFKKQVNTLRKEFQAARTAEEKRLDALAKEMGIAVDSPEYEALWDHIYNNSDWMFQYSK